MKKLFSALVLAAAANVAQAYPAWQAEVYYTAGTIVSYNGADYMALVNQHRHGLDAIAREPVAAYR